MALCGIPRFFISLRTSHCALRTPSTSTSSPMEIFRNSPLHILREFGMILSCKVGEGVPHSGKKGVCHMKKAYLATLFAVGVALAASADNNWFAASVSGLIGAEWKDSKAPTVSDNAWQLAGNSPVLSLKKTLDDTQTKMDATMSFEVAFDNAYLQSELNDVTVPQNAQGGILVAYDANNSGPYYYYRNGSAWTQLSNTAVSESALGTPVTVTVKITYSKLQTSEKPTIAYEIGDIKSAVVTMASSPSGAVAAITCGGFGSVASLVGSTDVAVAKKGNEKVTAENLASVFNGSGTVELLADCTYSPTANGQYLVKKNGKKFTFTKPTGGVTFEAAASEGVVSYRARTSAAFSGGDGSQAKPYKIANATDILELQYFSAGNDFAGEYFSQTANIDLANLGKQNGDDVATLSGIANFSGTYDGGNKTISNLKLAAGTYKGLFAMITGATLKDLTINNCTLIGDVASAGGSFFVGKMYGGSLIGLKATGEAKFNDATTFTHNFAGIVTRIGSVADEDAVVSTENIITDCSNEVNLNSTGSKVAGIVSIIEGKNVSEAQKHPVEVKFTNCKNTGSLNCTITSDGGVAGIIAYVGVDTTLCRLTDCENSGSVTLTTTKTGYKKGALVGTINGKNAVTRKLVCEVTGVNKFNNDYAALGFVVNPSEVGDISSFYFAQLVGGKYQLPVTVAAEGTYRCTYPNNQSISLSEGQWVTIDHAVATYARNFGEQVVAETVTGTLHQYTAIKGADPENEWVKQNVPEGKTIQQVMDEEQENGNKGFQNFALGLNKEEHLKVTAVAATSGTSVNFTANAHDAGSGMEVKFEILNASDVKVADGTSLDIATVADGRYKIKAYVKGDAVASDCENEIGLMRPASTKATTIVAVPFKNIGTGDINVTDVVNPAFLSDGDTLQVFKGDKFDNYTVIGGVWQAATTVSKNGASDASGGTIARGSAVILNRQNKTKPIVLLGQCDDLEVETSIGSGTSKPVWNLVASPRETAIDPKTLLNVKKEGVAEADSICIPNDSGAPDIIEFNGTQCGSYQKTIDKNGHMIYKWVAVSSIPAGTGFYYLGRGNRDSITW